MKYSDLKSWTARAAAWADEYFAGLRDRSVRPAVAPGAVRAQLPANPPEAAEPMETIFADFERIVPDAMTHWQHPRFFAYFPSNAAPASMLAEYLANAIAAQGMLWQTAPAATEIEQVMVDWLRQALGLADHFTGVIHDTATTATLSAVLTMRERALDWRGSREGLSGAAVLRLYASAECHSSIDKAARLAGVGQANLVKVATGPDRAMDPEALKAAITEDKAAGRLPIGVIVCVGGTSTGASDRPKEIIEAAQAFGLPTHVDAAWAGSAMICPELRDLWTGVDEADSIVFNAHKWLGASFDCSVQFLKDPAAQVRTMGLRPNYLETPGEDEIVNFNEWTIPLGRRFRALKLWFLIRAYGLDGLRARIRNHVKWAHELEAKFGDDPDFVVTTTCPLALFSFQYAPEGGDANALTEALLQRVNTDGRVYLTQTTIEGTEGQPLYIIRVSVGQFDCTREDVMMVYDVVRELSGVVSAEAN